MTKLYVVSKSEYNNKIVANFRVDQDSYELIIDNNVNSVTVWKARYIKMGKGYEKETFPIVIFKGSKSDVIRTFKNPKDLIQELHDTKY